MSTGPASRSANASGCARASVLGTSSPNTMVNSDSRIVTSSSAMTDAGPDSMPSPTRRSASATARLTPAKAEARNPMNVIASWMTARKRPGSDVRRRTRSAPRRPSSTSWSTRLRRSETSAISAATNTALSRTSRTMIPISSRVLPIRRGPLPRGSGGRRLGLRVWLRVCCVASSPDAGIGRGSRIRAGMPTASLPGGTSRVTTAPAPVLLSSPRVTGARSIVSTPRNTRSPIVVRCFLTPS